MAFDLRIAMKRDPLEATASEVTGPSSGVPRPPCVSLVVNGVLDEPGCNELMFRVRRSFDKGADTVIIELENIELPNAVCLHRFADSVMAERSAGRQVQVIAREPALYARCASISDSRDWLIADSTIDVTAGRRAIHLDSGHDPA
ncbi:MAG: hypothetical protein GIW96_06925 [Candidatus Eremiobacteraeota bacterium]|nr:hypothetical protein [Candidatus Eremiobacteraeota bacterium]